MELVCSRSGWGAVDHPETGELIHLDESHDEETAKLIAESYEYIEVVSEDYECGVNDCGRTVENPTDVCWQHSSD